MNLLKLFYSQQNYTFRGQYVICHTLFNMSYFEGARVIPSHWHADTPPPTLKAVKKMYTFLMILIKKNCRKLSSKINLGNNCTQAEFWNSNYKLVEISLDIRKLNSNKSTDFGFKNSLFPEQNNIFPKYIYFFISKWKVSVVADKHF